MYWTLKKTTLLDGFLGNFLIPSKQQFCRTCVKGFFNCAIHLFPTQNKFFALHLVDVVLLNFYFYLVPLFYFLKWNRYFSACEQKFAEFVMSVFLQILHPSSVPSKITRKLYTLVKSSPLKFKFLRFLSARVKIC